MTDLLNVLSKKNKSLIGKRNFDHFIQNIKSVKYISLLNPPSLESLKDKMVELPYQESESKLLE